MPTNKRIQFSINISAPVSVVFQTMLDSESYRDWTTAFAEGSYYEGSWLQGEKIKFMAPSGGGMVSEIAEHRKDEFISIRHLGFINNGVEDTESEAIRAWAPAYENYTFIKTADGTKLVIDQDITEEFEQYISEAWPKALQRLKELCEAKSAG
jgi:Activator of Hsp90 ATPase homolog 1-like protein